MTRDFNIACGLAIVAVSMAVLFGLIIYHTPATVYVTVIEKEFYPVDRVVVVEKPVILPRPHKGTIPLWREEQPQKRQVAKEEP